MVASTGLGIACMLGSLASVRITRSNGLEFVWHWSILLVAAAGVVWNSRFWRAVWETQRSSNPQAQRRLIVHLVALVLLGAGSFLYPIRFIEQSYWNGILKGLLTAVTFLGTMIYLIYKTVKGLEEIDSTELERTSP